jgi:hypothetical protein
MVVVILITVGCFAGGAWAASRWLPELAPGPVATLAFFFVCGLLGAALCVLGLHVYDIVRALEMRTDFGNDADAVAGNLRVAFFESGTLVALALVAFLLAPADEDELGAAENRLT